MHTCYLTELNSGLISLHEEEAIHVARVLRMKEGEVVRLIDGVGGEALGRLMSVSKRAVQVQIDEVQREATRPRGLTLVVAPTKHTDRFEWLLEKATELGVEEVIPVWTERSERRVDKNSRWDKVIVSATKQCQRRWKPLFHAACALRDVLDCHPHLNQKSGAVAHCVSEVEDVPQREPWLKWQAKHEDAWIAIGPEGDFSVEEIQFLNGHGASPVHLGDLRLRTETAGVAAMAQFS